MRTSILVATFTALSVASALSISLAVLAEAAPIAFAPYAPPAVAAPAESREAVVQTQVADAAARRQYQTRVRVGALVRPSTGGPLMTVRSIKHGFAICDWESWSGARTKARFPISQLVVIGGPGSPASRPLTEPQPYRPCPADVIAANGRHECLD